ncbi:DUF4352 domain-containing protein [Streptomyces sp. NPDC051000]|uniref:DUF4352 domain-containing protein n=1 Tax=unclassified Streptomyces TaxID=2593676 RepID=UPI0033F1D2B3
MSQQPPYGNQPPPGYGYPPPQPPPRKSGAGKIVGFSCLGIVGLVVVLAVAGSMLGDDTDDKTVKPSTAGASQPSKQADPAPAAKPEKKSPITVTAKAAAFKPSVLAQGDYTSVSVTVTNNSTKQISVNPLYFAITDTAGTKHGPELGVDEAQIDTVDLAPGENVTGVISGKGKFTAKKVTYTDGLLGDGVRADVS